MSITQAWDKTKGYKTASGGVLLLLFQFIKLVSNREIPDEWQELVYNGIGLIAATGVFDKLWRNRRKMIEWVKDLFRRNENKVKQSVNDGRNQDSSV
ncbi:MAG: hypothetical protein M0Q91_11920 [Methanoregula sp.]|jgi:hypothetical protein|nr:hypothetical protein [Methanoregula sp.]